MKKKKKKKKKVMRLDRFCIFPAYTCGLCTNNSNNNIDHDEDAVETNPLINHPSLSSSSPLRLKDMIAAAPATSTLAYQLKPKKVVLRVSMHCGGCARKVEKHISKLAGVSWYQVDLETKMVVVTGDILPMELLHSVSKVKFAQLWNTQS